MTCLLEMPIAEVCLASGLWLEDDWYALKSLDRNTLAIGEPAYHQCNWSYLISDGDQSLLWDTGSGRRPIAPLVARHGRSRVTAFPSHMHHDHLGAVCDFGPVMLADLPCLRALEKRDRVTPPEECYLGAYEGLCPPSFEVGFWLRPGECAAVGARRLELLHTPGHSPESVSLWEAARARLYAADFIYPGEVYAQVPGASLPCYVQSLRQLLKVLPHNVEILCAHGQEVAGLHDMPTLGYSDLQDLLQTVSALLSEPAHKGARRINARMELLYSAAAFKHG